MTEAPATLKTGTGPEVEAVCEHVRELGFVPHCIPGANRTAIGITGNPGPVSSAEFETMAGVAQAIPVTKPYKLVLREIRDSNTVVEVSRPGCSTVRIGGRGVILIAGPCAVESREGMLEAARQVQAAGAHLLRGGAFKPRTSPYSFQGLGKEGLEILAEARAQTGLMVVTEAVDVAVVDLLEEYADVIQIGARNMQSYSLLKRVGQTSKPVLLKRGMSATLSDLLQAAEYILSEGNYHVVLCERGIRTFADHTRNTLDLSIVPVLKRQTHLPVIIDPSHGTGSRPDVLPMALAAVAAGADGVMVEAHPHPEKALSDGSQSLPPAAFADLVRRLRRVAQAVDRSL